MSCPRLIAMRRQASVGEARLIAVNSVKGILSMKTPVRGFANSICFIDSAQRWKSLCSFQNVYPTSG